MEEDYFYYFPEEIKKHIEKIKNPKYKIGDIVIVYLDGCFIQGKIYLANFIIKENQEYEELNFVGWKYCIAFNEYLYGYKLGDLESRWFYEENILKKIN